MNKCLAISIFISIQILSIEQRYLNMKRSQRPCVSISDTLPSKYVFAIESEMSITIYSSGL